ncbi:MAG TPA: LapA family protein [Gaiellaceae bacterium]|nr:LapA family protein [Gaiellaceae bacterium]
MGEGPSEPSKAKKKASRGGVAGFSWRTIVLVLLGIYAVLLIVVNSKRVNVDFVFFHAATRVVWLVLLSMALGALIMWLIPRFRHKRPDKS